MGSVWDEMQERAAAREREIRELLGEVIDVIARQADFGSPSAVKRGRTTGRPYVPIIVRDTPAGRRTTQLRGLAYASRADAVARAERAIAAYRQQLANDLAKPNHRAMREQYGLPREPGRPTEPSDKETRQ